MNKIFKIVWNHNIGSYTVVSELAKGKTKASSEQNNSISEAGKGRLKKQFILTALALSLGVESAWAMIPEGNASGTAAIAVGTDSKATTTQSIAIGWTAQATGATQAVAIGPDAIASGTQSTSIGNNTRATGDSSIAIGGDDWNIVRTKPVAAAGNKQVHQVFQELTGMEMKANGEAYKNPFKGTTSADAAVAVGVNAYAEGVLSTAFGSGTSATGLGASAFGVGASASKDKSVAIGAGSNTSMDAAAITTATVNGITYNGFAGATKITAGSQVSVGRPGYERQIKHVAPGEISATSTDAINGSQLYQVAVQAANPLKFDGDSGTTVERKLGSTLNVKGGATGTLTDNNIGVVADKSSNTLRLKLAQNVNLGDAGSLQTGSTTINDDGVVITGGPSITKTGISAGNKPITNVASGGTTDSNAANISDVKKAAAAAKTVVKQGANTTVSSATNAATGATEYTVNAEKSVVQGSSDVSVNAVTNGLTTTYTADLSTTAKASLAKADTAVQKVVSSNPNLTTSTTGDTVTLDFSQTPSFTSVTTGSSVLTSDGLKIGSGANSVSLTNAGLSNGGNKITNIADGAADTDAASYKQVKAAKTEVQAGTNVASVIKTDGTNGQAIYTVNAKAVAVTLENGADGLKLTSAEDATSNLTTYKLDLSDKTKASLTKADSALQNIGVQVNGTAAKTLNQTNSTLNFVNGTGTTAENKNGDIAFNVNKANLSVNGGTVSADKQGDEFATAKSVADAINQAVTDSEKTSVVAAGDNTHVASAVSGNQTTYTVHADKTTVSAKAGGKLALNSTEVTNSNQTKTTNYELDLTDDAKAEIQKGVDAKTAVDTQGIGFAADNGSAVTKKLGDSLNIKGDNKNITTKINNGDVHVTLNDDISVQNVNASASVITPKVVAGDSTLTSDGLNITGGPSITKTGISAGNKPITNVASGGTTDSNAANIGDVKKAAAAAKTVVKQGANTTVSSATDAATGATEYTVNAEKSVVQGSSDVSVNAVTNGLTTTYTADLSTTAKASLAKADSAVQKVVSSNPNLTASKTGDTVTLDFSQTPNFTSVTAGNSKLSSDGLKIGSGTSQVSLTNAGLNNGGNKVVNVRDGEVSSTSTDAVNGRQLHNVQQVINQGFNINADNNTPDNVKLGEMVSYNGDDNIKTKVSDNQVQFALANTVKIGSTSGKPITIDGVNGAVSGLQNTTLGGNDFAKHNKAASEEQLNAAQSNLANLIGGSVVNNNGNVSANDIGGTGKGNIDDAIRSIKQTANQGWNLKVNNETSSEKILPDDTVNFREGDNIKVTRNGKSVTVGTKKDVIFDNIAATVGINTPKVTAGNTVLDTNGLTITNGTNPVSLTNAGLNNGGNKVTNIADGEADTDAASYKQVKAAKTEVQAGTNVASVIKTDGTNGQAIYTVNAKAVAVTLENGADGLKLTSAEDATSNLTTYKLDLSDKTKASLTKADSALQNIGVQVNGTAAKTLNQANSTLNFVNGTGTTAENKNGNIAFNVNKANLSVNGGTVSADKNGDEFATAKSVADAINQAVTNSEKTSVVAAGDNTHVASAVSGNQTTYTVHADKTTVSAKTGGKLTVTSAQTVNANQTKTTNYELDLTDAAKAEIAKGVEAKTAVDTKGIGFAADSGSPVTKKLGDSLNIKGDNKNIETVAGSSGINVKLKDQITVKTAKADTFKAGDSTLNSDGLKINKGANPVELTKAGLNNGGNKITNVAKGTADTDAVNLAQLKDAAAAASNKVESGNANIVVKPVNNADGSTTYKVATADKLTADSFTAGNTVVNNGGVKVGNAVALGNDGLKAGNVSVGTNGINAGNHAVKNVAKGVNDTDAVNVAQLREQIAAGVKTTTVVAGKNVTVSNKVNGNNTEYTINAEKTTVSAAAGGAVKVNAGTKNADGVTDYAVDLTDAAKADIAKGVAAKNTVDNKGLTFNADGSTTTGVKKLGDTVAINGDGNIITKADANGIQIGLNKNLNVQSVKAGDTTLNNSGVAVGGNVALTQNGLKAGNVNVSASGIDAGGNKITRVAPGVVAAGSTDAVNGGQLYAVNQAARAAKTEVVAGKNIVVTESQGANGQSVYQVATSDNLTVGSVKAGATTVNDRGISIALPTAHDPENAVSLSPDGLNNGGQRISNVAPGRVGTDAVNLNQLAGLGNALQNNIDRVGKKAYSGVAGAIAQGSIPQVTRPGATGIGVGSGYYGGQSAMAIGVSAMSDGGNWIVKGNFSANTGGHVGVGAGALYQW